MRSISAFASWSRPVERQSADSSWKAMSLASASISRMRRISPGLSSISRTFTCLSAILPSPYCGLLYWKKASEATVYCPSLCLRQCGDYQPEILDRSDDFQKLVQVYGLDD